MNKAKAAHVSARPAAWKLPDAPELFKFINSTPLVASLLYDINLLPEQIDNARHWNYMCAVCEHMRAAIAEQAAERVVALSAAAELEEAVMEVMNGKRKAGKLPVEPMVRLIAYARTGSTKNASVSAPAA